MRQLSEVKDPRFEKPAEWGAFNRFFLKFIRDERDLPFVHLSLKLTFTVIPLAILLFTNLVTGWMWWATAALHFVLCVGVYLGPFTLMLHNTSHRRFFKKEYDWMNKYIPWVLGPFMGQSPELYFIHHMGMHHLEGNMPEDGSSTMPYQRDSFIDFMKYYLRFMFIGVFELMNYFNKKKRKRFIPRIVIGEFSFYIMCIILGYFNLAATVFVFILPLVAVRFGMMSGNWGQHAFVDPTEPDNDFTNSINCINNGYNQKCFNDGYHIVHHIVPNMHWTDQPQSFLDNTEKYAKNKALVFEGLDFHSVWFFLMIKRYDVLAKHVVNLHGTFESDEEVIELMKQRTRKFSMEELNNFVPA